MEIFLSFDKYLSTRFDIFFARNRKFCFDVCKMSVTSTVTAKLKSLQYNIFLMTNSRMDPNMLI